jgi:hypothetical protein
MGVTSGERRGLSASSCVKIKYSCLHIVVVIVIIVIITIIIIRRIGPEGKKPLGRLRLRWENIKMYLER